MHPTDHNFDFIDFDAPPAPGWGMALVILAMAVGTAVVGWLAVAGLAARWIGGGR